ncbi:MAG TPA: HD domain-containing phosphohydrolase [Gemmatimonadaceae bacterium]|nr:HD domain-containing phosphohydrolase [Gemmatimonadaceae bacterium]
MTAPGAGATAPVRGAPAGIDSFIRRAGKAVVGSLYGALRALKLYPVENAAVQKALADLVAAAGAVLARDHELTVRASGEVLFVNDARLRLELDSYAAFNHVLGVWRACGIGTLRVSAAAGPRDWLALLNALQRPSAAAPAERLEEVRERLHLAGIRPFELAAPADELDDEYEEEAKATSKRLYAQSVAVAREVLQSARVGRPPSLRKMKRAVQGIVDQILTDETPLVGLTTLRDFDEYTFTHSVNVGIFSVAIGKRLGLSKLQLYDLGLAAFLHDLGKTRLPAALINKTGDLAPEEWALIRAHPWLGVLAMFGMQGMAQELPMRAMRVAYEHHLRVDSAGYPRPIRPREQGLFSRIVAVADSFDAATSRRSYQPTPHAPADVLREMRENPARGLDPVVVKALINTIGIYPVGTVVVLDTLELAVVHAASTHPEALSRPVVRVVTDALGNSVFPGQLVDLNARDAGGAYPRTIINTVDPERYGIRVSDYFI